MMRVISLFCGAGGMDLGFSQAGHQLIWANDIWKDAVQTYRLNLGEHVVCADISQIECASIPDGDIVIGGFPCQGFSVANMRRSSGDVRNSMYLEFRRIVAAKR